MNGKFIMCLIAVGMLGIVATSFGMGVNYSKLTQEPIVETRTELQCSVKGDEKLQITYDPTNHRVTCGTTHVVE